MTDSTRASRSVTLHVDNSSTMCGGDQLIALATILRYLHAFSLVLRTSYPSVELRVGTLPTEIRDMLDINAWEALVHDYNAQYLRDQEPPAPDAMISFFPDFLTAPMVRWTAKLDQLLAANADQHSFHIPVSQLTMLQVPHPEITTVARLLHPLRTSSATSTSTSPSPSTAAGERNNIVVVHLDSLTEPREFENNIRTFVSTRPASKVSIIAAYKSSEDIELVKGWCIENGASSIDVIAASVVPLQRLLICLESDAVFGCTTSRDIFALTLLDTISTTTIVGVTDPRFVLLNGVMERQMPHSIEPVMPVESSRMSGSPFFYGYHARNQLKPSGILNTPMAISSEGTVPLWMLIIIVLVATVPIILGAWMCLYETRRLRTLVNRYQPIIVNP